jgi:Fe-S-cluster containining protein
MKPPFSCRRCGACCGLVHFTKPDYERAKCRAKALGLPLVKNDLAGKFKKAMYLPKPMAERIEGLSFEQIIRLSGEELTCPFLGWDEGKWAVCRIYAVRPDICRMFGAGNVPELVCRHQKEELCL